MPDLSPELLSPHVGTTFRVVDESGASPVALQLTEVQLGRLQPGAPREQPFTLAFTGPRDRMLEQATYVLEHDVLGRVEIFLVPVDAGVYEAVFN